MQVSSVVLVVWVGVRLALSALAEYEMGVSQCAVKVSVMSAA